MIRSLVSGLFLFLAGCAQREFVVLYTSQDQFYAEPILKEFTAATGIEVRPVFDNESAKTAALAHRLRAEKSNPQCDVFWSNEEMHTRLLVRDGVIDSDHWKAVGFRTRRLVINTNLVALSDAPASLLELTQEKWRGKLALSYPLFGTTSAYFLALRQHWGDSQWRAWSEGIIRNGAKVVDGNSVVVRLVGAGECAIGLTDSDDVKAGQRQGLPVAAVEKVEEGLIIPNTISIINRAPHPELAARLVEYLSNPLTLQKLVQLGALEGVDPAPLNGPQIKIDWDSALADLEGMNEVLKSIFIRS